MDSQSDGLGLKEPGLTSQTAQISPRSSSAAQNEKATIQPTVNNTANPSLPSNICKTVRRDRNTLVRKLKLFVILHIVYLVPIIYLFAVSNNSIEGGLINVKNWEYLKEEKGAYDAKSLLWTSLPAFFFSMFALCMGFCYGDIQELLPYLRLYKKGDAGKNSVLVNYALEAPHKSIFNAWERKHRFISFSIFLSSLFSIAVVPLSAHMFETKLRTASVAGNATSITVWNEGNLNNGTDYSRALEVASAIDVYNTGHTILSQWMNTEYAFPSFRASKIGWPYNSTVIIPGVTGRGAYLDNLKFVDEDEYRISRTNSTSNDDDDATGALKISATYEGCLITHEVPIFGDEYDFYFNVGVSKCNISSVKKGDSGTRIFFILAWPASNSKAARVSYRLIIGTPVHATQLGTLAVAVREGFSITDFFSGDGREPVNNPPPFEEGIATPKGSGKLDRIRAKAFASLILDRFDIARRDVSAPWTGLSADTEKEFKSEMLKAIDKVYKTVFTVSASLYGFEPTEWPLDYQNSNVRVTRHVERLFIVNEVTVFIIATLCFSFITALWAWRLGSKLLASLVDRPGNLIDSYALFHACSSLGPMIEDVLVSDDYDGNFTDTARKRWTLDDAQFAIKRCEGGGPKMEVWDLTRK
ncbi:hypothetical protein ACHAPT_011897 [Fusarium lateritium]